VTLPPFERTVCACPADVAHCKVRPGFLLTDDVARIGLALAERGEIDRPQAIVQVLRASKGAKVWSVERGAFRIGTITPRMVGGRCVFLDPEDRCRIHAIAPFGCRYFDGHMSREEGDRRSTWGLTHIMDDPHYAALREALIALHGGEEEPFETKEASEG
jgi:Fe-S-cluster containining protein